MRRAVDRVPGIGPGRTSDIQAVAAIVTCHNYGRYLARCIQSLRDQITPFQEILIVDDASDDNTPQVAAQFPTVQYLRGEWRDVCRARNAGMDVTRSPLIVNVDADNWLGPSFLADLLPAMDDLDVGLSYSTPNLVGEYDLPLTHESAVKPFNYETLAQENHIDTCSIVRREAVDRCGRWYGNSRYGDWHLYLRMTRAGWGVRYCEKRNWAYRDHPASMSRATEQDDVAVRVELLQSATNLMVVTPFCGRTWAMKPYLRGLARLDWDKSRMHLLAIDNSDDPAYSKSLVTALTKATAGWSGMTLLRTDRHSREGVANAEFAASVPLRLMYGFGGHMAYLYSDLAERHLPPGFDWVMSLEDDIEVMTPKPLATLLSAFRPQTPVIGGVVRSRFWEGAPIAYEVTSEYPYMHVQSSERGDSQDVFPVGGMGFGCNLWRAPIWHRHIARRGSVAGGESYDWHDCATYANIRRAGYQPMLHWGVRTRHWQDARRYF